MDYLLIRNFLLMLTVGAIINARVHRTLVEPMVPSMVAACLGSNPTINCSFYTDAKGLKVKWYFSNTSDFKHNEKIQSSNRSSVSHYHEAQGWTASFLTIKNVTFSDMGWYFCEVTQDIPELIDKHSNGSKLVIYSPTESNVEYNTTTCDSPTGSNFKCNTTNSTTICASETPNASPWWLWVVLAVGCVLIITSVIITTVIRRRKKESPVYENTKEASKRQWKEDQSLQRSMPSKGYSNKQMDTLTPHKYESCPKGRQPSPKHK
ncbi:uncharacterized protein LOC131360231 isoform X1 [Hemibagrus wyckioides]|uniref:uncharacterized protein LOC131360231 isoform X1 n=1 Tax=Hemibagrus wyckioides TaxID=337641 RepID=UPI00266BFF54|nr:uncharacterized protein LOC131360231 isoform X1 [Hemibagrus wyckioides]